LGGGGERRSLLRRDKFDVLRFDAQRLVDRRPFIYGICLTQRTVGRGIPGSAVADFKPVCRLGLRWNIQ